MTGAELIQKERERQITEEGWTPEHDDQHDLGQILAAAICYAHNAGDYKMAPPRQWPWDESWWKPTGKTIRDLTKAGALIAAEIDRLLRADKRMEDKLGTDGRN